MRCTSLAKKGCKEPMVPRFVAAPIGAALNIVAVLQFVGVTGPSPTPLDRAVARMSSHQATQYRSEVNTVAIYATAYDSDGRLVPGLKSEDFRVFDNGQPVELTVFSDGPQPITVAVMLDMSGSVGPSFWLI